MKFLAIPLLLLSTVQNASASLKINEVAYKGSSNTCNGEDWIELISTTTSLDLFNYTLHDDKGKNDDKAKLFSESIIINPGEYLVLCRNVDFDFGIGSDDVVTLLDDTGEIVSEVMLLGSSEADLTFASFEEGGYQYTAMPTPGEENVYVKPKPLEVKLAEQNEAGNDFFLEGDDGEDGVIFEKVVDLHVTLGNESLATIVDHPTWEEFVPFIDVAVSNPSDTTSIIASAGTGKIRTKGQSTLLLTSCFGLPNVPFQIEFDTPFMGMEIVYLRNHIGDPSYMRDYASHFMLRRFGLPYLRSRPARLFMNGQYVGFYTLLEAPVQGYVMQRSFGVFQPEDTALYKVKSQVAQCPVTDPAAIAAKSDEPPNPYYFERGDHRAGIPTFEDDTMDDAERFETCYAYFFGEMGKEGADLTQGILHYNNSCGTALVSLGRVDRDYGPKSTEEAMINTLDSVLYNESVSDIKPFINADQWIKNFASYAVTLNQDSVIEIVNNWYLATLDNGASWSIVQYDHNSIATDGVKSLCGAGCGPRMIYHPILRPTCKAVEDNPILGRVLNDDQSWETYLNYVEEFVGVVESSIADLRSYGNDIKTYLVDDWFATTTNFTVKSYEESELGLDYSDYNTASKPLLKTLSARLVEVKAQLDAIREGTMPRDGKYGENEICPDWRDNDGSDYIAGSTYVEDSCAMPIPDCEQAAPCYENSPFTCVDGNLVIEECKQASPFCDSCFPASACGGGLTDASGEFVESDTCGPEFAECSLGSPCFDHNSGICAFDGSILTEECREAELYCKSCFPYSRCGTLEEGEEGSPKEESGNFVESDTCGPEFAECSMGAICFDHNGGICADDGSIMAEDCKQAELFCKPCFPFSRCGTSEDEEESGKFVESDTCGQEFASCSMGAICFDHNGGICADDGSMLAEDCKEAELFCKPCFPYSRCGTLEVKGVDDESIEGEEEEPTDGDSSPDDEPSSAKNKASNIIALMSISFGLLSWFQF